MKYFLLFLTTMNCIALTTNRFTAVGDMQFGRDMQYVRIDPTNLLCATCGVVTNNAPGNYFRICGEAAVRSPSCGTWVFNGGGNSGFSYVGDSCNCTNIPVYQCADSDATNFISRASITDTNVQGYLCTMVTSLKSANLWTNFYAIYPFAAATTNGDAINLYTNGLYTISWAGSLTNPVNHSAFGISNSFSATTVTSGNTSFNSQTVGNTNISFGAWQVYLRKGHGVFVENTGNDYNRLGLILSGVNDNKYFIAVNETIPAGGNLANNTLTATNDAWVSLSRINKTVYFQQNSVFTSYTATTTNLVNANMFIANGATGTNVCGFAYIANGFTTNQLTTLQSIVSTFETSMGR